MFARLSNGWELAQQSFRVLMLDKELLLFPVLSGLACLLVLVSFAVPLWNTGYVSTVLEEQTVPEDPLTYVILFAFYFVNYSVIVFFNSALIACAIIRFRGGNPTLADGLRAAMSCLPQILGWAAVSATVGVILRVIESRSERFGEIVSGLLGMAWTIVTYFVVPILVVERVGPIEATRRSMSIMRRTWGEALTANFGIGIITFLAFLVALIPLVGGIFAWAAGTIYFAIPLCVVGVVLLLLVGLVSSAVDAILIGSLYLYAADGIVPQNFDGHLLRQAFARR